MAWKLTVIWSFNSLLRISVQSWMPSYLIKTYGVDLKQVSLVTMQPNLVAFPGTNAVGPLCWTNTTKDARGYLSSSARFLARCSLHSRSMDSIQLCLCYGFCSTASALPRAHDRERHRPDEFGGQIGGSVAPTAMGVLIAVIGGSYLMAFCLLAASALASAVVAMSWRTVGQSAFGVQPTGARLRQEFT
jgi:MFS transporter, ACS family, hexuronate transporter